MVQVTGSSSSDLCPEWRRGQDSNLHSLSAGGFQDRKVGRDLIRRPRIYQSESGCAAIKVIEVVAGSFPSARQLRARFRGK